MSKPCCKYHSRLKEEDNLDVCSSNYTSTKAMRKAKKQERLNRTKGRRT